MKLQNIAFTKIQTSELFSYPNSSKKTFSKSDNYEPLKVCQQGKKYILVDGYSRYHSSKKNWQCLVFEQNDFFFLWESKLLDKFYHSQTHWIGIGQSLQKISVCLQKSILQIINHSKIKSIIPNAQFLDILLEMVRRKDFLLKILPAESWTIQNYKIFRKNTDQEILFLAKKLSPFCLNFGQYKQILEILYDLKRLKKCSISNLLEELLTPEISLSDFKKNIFILRNPFASRIFAQRKKALQKLRLPSTIQITYNEDLEQPLLFFRCQTKNTKDWQKLLNFFQKDVLFIKNEIENLYQLL